MNPEIIETETIAYLKRLFNERPSTACTIINTFFIDGNFCYIEQEGQDQIIFRLKDSRNNMASLTVQYSSITAYVVEISADQELNRIEYIYPLLLEGIIMAINNKNNALFIKVTGDELEENFIKSMDHFGGELEESHIKLNLCQQDRPPISILLAGKKRADSHHKENCDYNEIEPEALICKVVGCVLGRVPYFIFLEEDLNDATFTSILNDERGETTVGIELEYCSTNTLEVAWYGGHELEVQIVCKLIDRIILHAISHGVTIVECITRKYDKNALLCKFPLDLMAAFEMYGFRYSRLQRRMRLKLNK